MSDCNVYLYQLSLSITKTKGVVSMIKSHLFASQVVHPSTCFVSSLQKTVVLLFSYLVAWTYMRQSIWKKPANEQACKRPMEMMINFVLLSEVYFVPDKVFQSIIGVKSKCLWISSSYKHLPFSMIVLINWAPLSDGFQAGFLIYTCKNENKHNNY